MWIFKLVVYAVLALLVLGAIAAFKDEAAKRKVREAKEREDEALRMRLNEAASSIRRRHE